MKCAQDQTGPSKSERRHAAGLEGAQNRWPRQRAAREAANLGDGGARAPPNKRARQVTSEQQYLDQLTLESDFVCAPRANLPAAAASTTPKRVGASWRTPLRAPLKGAPYLAGPASEEQESNNRVDQYPRANIGPLEALRLAFDYLEPTLVRRRRPRQRGPPGPQDVGGAPPVAGRAKVARERHERLQAREGEFKVSTGRGQGADWPPSVAQQPA